MDHRDLEPFAPDVFEGGAVDAARAVIGAVLLVNGVGGIIVEAEAYDQTDPASHSYKGLRPSNQSMFGPPGHAYVYRSYGVHWCLNFVCEASGHGAGVLIRALEPVYGIETMQGRRGMQSLALLCRGPGRLTQALAVDQHHDGLSLARQPFTLLRPIATPEVVVGTRIGITKAVEKPWRFGLAGSRYLSRRFPVAAVRT